MIMTSNTKSKPSVIVVNMLKDMVENGRPFPMPPEFKERVVPRIAQLIESARNVKIPVVYVCDAHRPGDPEFSDFPGGAEHAVKGTGGEEVIDDVKPLPGDYVVHKRRFSGFFGTDLENLLKELGVDTLIFVGRPTNVCVLYTVADAFQRGYSVLVAEDCLYSKTKEYHQSGLDAMFFARKITLDEFIREFGGGGAK
jgi:nicotinamidase-related amidase